MDKPMKILVINSGSSSIKFELFVMPEEKVEAKGMVQRIGEDGASLSYRIGDHDKEIASEIADHAAGLRLIMDTLTGSKRGGLSDIAEIGAVGHRVVHGGEAFSETVIIDETVEAAINEHAGLAPLPNPPNLQGIQVSRALLPDVPQVAVFDTAFHQSIPEYAYLYAVPRELHRDHGVRRYGFHGTSHRFVTQQAARMLGKGRYDVNLITAHLGNGASMAAVRKGRSVDTSMGLTPLEGLVMGTRCGDIDPAIPAYLERVKGLSLAETDRLLNKQSGLLGLSQVSNDVRTLIDAEADGNADAAVALAIYCYRIRKYIGAYTATLGEVDALVFTAGVGENSPQVRERAVAKLAPMGYELDEVKNAEAVGKAKDVATAGSRSRILVIPTNEELLIAKDTYRLASE